MAPKTTWGRLVTIVYAIVGIPLTFLYLSNIGNFFADCFRLIYKKICCDILCCKTCERKKKRERLRLKRQRELNNQREEALKSLRLEENLEETNCDHKKEETVKINEIKKEGEKDETYELPIRETAILDDDEVFLSSRNILENIDSARETAILDSFETDDGRDEISPNEQSSPGRNFLNSVLYKSKILSYFSPL